MDIDQRTTTVGGRGSRVILLGDGSETNNDSHQRWSEGMDDSEESFDASDVTEREDTPAPEPAQPWEKANSTNENSEHVTSQGEKQLNEETTSNQAKYDSTTETESKTGDKNKTES